MTVLCERCFPDWRDREVLTIVPISPCVQCGVYDQRKVNPSLAAHAFRCDPRAEAEAA